MADNIKTDQEKKMDKLQKMRIREIPRICLDGKVDRVYLMGTVQDEFGWVKATVKLDIGCWQ